MKLYVDQIGFGNKIGGDDASGGSLSAKTITGSSLEFDLDFTGNSNILLCERGASFGYNSLVTDMRAIPILAKTGFPVVFDATHSVQQPGGRGSESGGQREFAPILARAAVSLGISAVFMETHHDPDNAPSDGPNMIPLSKI